MNSPTPLATVPRFGDVLLRGDGHGEFELVKAITHPNRFRRISPRSRPPSTWHARNAPR